MTTTPAVERVASGVPGLDRVLGGGLPVGRTTLVAGTAGSGKTVLVLQVVAEGLRQEDQGAVFVTFEERPETIRRHAQSLGLGLGAAEEAGRFAFIDASLDPAVEDEGPGAYDFSALLGRIEHHVRVTGGHRVALDSVGSVLGRLADPDLVRRELLRVTNGLRELGVTSLLTVERAEDHGALSRYGVEEFVCDNVLVLRHTPTDGARRRTVEVVKMRGMEHVSGEAPFTIASERGILVD